MILAFSRHPFILYPHFIERWKKRLSKGDETSVDDNEEDLMFIDDEDENIRRKKSKSNKVRFGMNGFDQLIGLIFLG